LRAEMTRREQRFVEGSKAVEAVSDERKGALAQGRW